MARLLADDASAKRPDRAPAPRLLTLLLWHACVLERLMVNSEQDSNIYGMLVDSQKVYMSHGAARDEIRAHGCFNGYEYSYCESIGGGQQFCLQCCNYNRQLRMFSETWNLRCSIER